MGNLRKWEQTDDYRWTKKSIRNEVHISCWTSQSCPQDLQMLHFSWTWVSTFCRDSKTFFTLLSHVHQEIIKLWRMISSIHILVDELLLVRILCPCRWRSSRRADPRPRGGQCASCPSRSRTSLTDSATAAPLWTVLLPGRSTPRGEGGCQYRISYKTLGLPFSVVWKRVFCE